MDALALRYNSYREKIEAELQGTLLTAEPHLLYDPVRYVLESGGKRIRPVLVLLACEAVGGRIEEAIPAAVSVELMHTFTLVHDDIMDNSDQRRGRLTVHKKWDENIAILAGDVLIGLSYQKLLLSAPHTIAVLTETLTRGMIDVSEGQSYDKEYEALPGISREQYMMMIEKKTARLIVTSAELGAIVGGADSRQREALYSFALNLGLAFQIQDDLLDVTADQKKLGKPVGSDINEGKKTYLLVDAMNHADGPALDLLRSVAEKRCTDSDMVRTVKSLYANLGVIERAEAMIQTLTETALVALDELPESEPRSMLIWYANMLLQRTN